MKYVVVLIEGLGDVARKELGGRTPLQVARCRAAARLAAEGRCGVAAPLRREVDRRPEVMAGLACGLSMHDATSLARGPVEAAAIRGDAGQADYVYRGNLIAMDAEQIRESLVSRLSHEETALLAQAVQEGFAPESVRFVATGPARVAVLVRGAKGPMEPGTPPHLADGLADAYLPQGKKGALARTVFELSGRALAGLTVNEVRVDLGENPATHLWLWGGGAPVRPNSWFGGRLLRGAVCTQNLLGEGLAALGNMRLVKMGQPWPESADHALPEADLRGAMQEADFLLVHVEAPRDGGWYGGATDKVRLVERADVLVLEPLRKLLEEFRPVRVLLATTPVHANDARGPVVLWGDGVAADGVTHWDEVSAREGGLGAVEPGDFFKWLVE